MSLLELDGIAKVYRAGTFGNDFKAALRGITFDITAGEVVSLIGQSGSGKSTLGKILLRLTAPSSGAARFEGRDITSWAGGRRRDYYRYVQGVFQDPFSSYNPLYKADRVFEMIHTVYFRAMSRGEWEAKVHAALEAVSLNPADVLNKFPHQLSGGQQQRLLIARALLLDVKLLVADEIISMLDASTRVDVLNLLVGLKRKGLGVLFITHDLSLGNYISDKTVILRRGAVVEMGDTRLVFGNPQHAYTKALLTAVPQLHKKWGPEHGPGAAAIASPAARVGEPLLEVEPEPAQEPMRYSKSPLHPKNWGDDDEAGHVRASRVEREEAARRRFAVRKPDYAAVLAADPAPPLLETEPGHFVADGD
jgi:ABC-type oligopeptide transport system ATPase subunit